MYGTRKCLASGRGMASTRHGMRRILKQFPRPVEYIQKAVETGIYRAPEELKAVMNLLQKIDNGTLPPEAYDEYELEPRTIVSRFKSDIVRGVHVHDYPPEYHILKLNPPVPEKARTPAKVIQKIKNDRYTYSKRKSVHEQSPAVFKKHLIEEYLRRNGKKEMKAYQHYTKLANESNINNDADQTVADDNLRYRTTDRDDRYYRSLFGIPDPAMSNGDQQNSGFYRHSLLSQAYEFGTQQYKLMRMQDMSEKEALDEVDKLLMEQKLGEAKHSRNIHETIIKQKKEQKENKKQQEEPLSMSDLEDDKEKSNTEEKAETNFAGPDDEEVDADTIDASIESIPAVLSSQPRTIEGMLQWNQKLHAVPYEEWTIGASTTLDHWIAKNVLQISESTWDVLLDGGHYNNVRNAGFIDDDEGNMYLNSIARDLIDTRHMLFPETNVKTRKQLENEDTKRFETEYAMEEREETRKQADEDKDDEEDLGSFDELLKSLRTSGSGNVGDEDKKGVSSQPSTWDDIMNEVSDDNDKSNTFRAGAAEDIDRLTDELQDYRRKHSEQSYESWSPEEQETFMNWLKEYVSTVVRAAQTADEDDDGGYFDGTRQTTNIEEQEIDWADTRDTLLNMPAVTRQGSKHFWDSVEDDVQAEAFLEQLRIDYESRQEHSVDESSKAENKDNSATMPKMTELPHLHYETFMKLPHDVQVKQLKNLGTLRPIFDEYNNDIGENSMQHFLSRYGNLLIEDVVMEHLIPDPEGPISLNDLLSNPHITKDMLGDLVDNSSADNAGGGNRRSWQKQGKEKEQRFRVVMLPYGATTESSPSGDESKPSVEITSLQSERSRILYFFWNKHKAARARYEETMFRMDQLGLRYEGGLKYET